MCLYMQFSYLLDISWPLAAVKWAAYSCVGHGQY